MRIHIFASGLLILLAGAIAIQMLPKLPAFEFLRGAFTLGGALLICGFFSIKMNWYGIIGAGVVSLLGAGKGILNWKDFPKYFAGDHSRGIAPFLEILITLICLILLVRVLRVLSAERTRMMLEADRH